MGLIEISDVGRKSVTLIPTSTILLISDLFMPRLIIPVYPAYDKKFKTYIFRVRYDTELIEYI